MAVGRAICSRETVSGVVIHVLFVRQIDADHEEILLHSSNATNHRSVGVQPESVDCRPVLPQAVGHSGASTRDAHVQSLHL